MGNHESADRSLASAKRGYSSVVRFMSDPKHIDRLTEEQREEFTAGLQRLRATLDELASRQK